MILNKQINKGWVTSATVLATRKVRATSNLVAGLIASKRVSAANFHKLESLASLLNHYKLHPDDKNIWDNKCPKTAPNGHIWKYFTNHNTQYKCKYFLKWSL